MNKETKKYRKKPVIVEAYQTDKELDIETLEGIMHASVGDYIITGVDGEQYPCKPQIFEKTYQSADIPDGWDVVKKIYKEMNINKKEFLQYGTQFDDEDSLAIGQDLETASLKIKEFLQEAGIEVE